MVELSALIAPPPSAFHPEQLNRHPLKVTFELVNRKFTPAVGEPGFPFITIFSKTIPVLPVIVTT